ncbi:MAG: NADP-dependent isocitrate dehydrogenase [Planctomycetota bacterium]
MTTSPSPASPFWGTEVGPSGAPHHAPDIAAVAIAHGDGIGPEIMDAALRVLDAAYARLDLRPIDLGQSVYEAGHAAGITPDAWDTIRSADALLKAPITTPQGGGYKSLNVTLRKTLGLFANVRPCRSLSPFVPTRFPGMDVVVVRENEEDTYAGIEHRQTQEVTQCLKLITRPGSERIVRYAFDYARTHGRGKVTCFVKDNIMKLTDGLFHDAFKRIAEEYPDIESDSRIIDIGAAELADSPERFDVIVTPNLYGDIVSDIAAQLTGSVGLGGSANIGEHVSMFEAIHGSAPDLAGLGVANPSGLLLAAVQMLVHVGQPDAAGRVHNAWLRTLEDGVHTPDIANPDTTRHKVGTAAFADAVIANLGNEPIHLNRVAYHSDEARGQTRAAAPAAPHVEEKKLVGIDVFLDWDEHDRSPEALGRLLEPLAGPELKLKMITNRGVKVFPGGFPETFCTDHWRCRFVPTETETISRYDVLKLLHRLAHHGLDFIKTEHLYTFDGKPGYSLGQGE